jgi:hypothetical protein
MHMLLRLPLLTGVLLACTPFALAESPLVPDPVPPAVIGRPLEQIKPARPVRPRPAAAKPAAAKPVAPKHAAARPAVATQRPAKQAVDDRADPRMQLDDVGKGTRLARKALGPGAYFGNKHRAAVRKYYEEHPVLFGGGSRWQIGEPVPRGARVKPVPKDLLARLPELPPGHRYVQLRGEVVLIAAESKMVVDGISRNPR